MILLTWLGLSGLDAGLHAQSPVYNPLDEGIRCGTMAHYAAQVAADPSIEQRRIEFEQKLAQWIADHPNGCPDVSVTIPVVVHILYNTEAQNRSDAVVQEQIDIMNTDYGGQNTHPMWEFSNSLKVNTDIQFCLAKQRPDGTPTNGIERRQTSETGFISNDNMKHYSSGGLDAWDVTQYMNIWVCNLTDYLGYAQFPWSGINSTFGLVVRTTAFGVTGAIAPYNLGGTATHELGHCFTLLHIWGDEPLCTGSDQCGDTPNQANKTFGHHTGLLTDICSTTSPGIMYMNFMDYSDDQDYANFTPNQKTRIQSCFNSGGYLYSLLSSTKCTPVTTSMSSDVPYTAGTDPDWFLFNNNVNYWCAVGIRPNTAGEDWDIHLYSDDGFNPPTIASSTNGSSIPVDFVVMDNNHAPKQSRGIKADRWSGSGPATIEFEGSAETLAFGTNSNISWPAGDVIEMWDIYLSPGTYDFMLTFNSGTANLGIALFGSNGAAYYSGRNGAMAIADANGNGIGEHFTATITTTDYYGLCVFANNGNAANININIGVLGQWLGTVSNNWNTAANWGAGVVPDETIDVNIQAGTPYAPVIHDGVSAMCKNLTIGNLATLTQNPTSYLYVYGNFNSDEGTFTQSGSSYLYFAGNTDSYWDDDNMDDTYNYVRVDKLDPAAKLQMWQDMTVNTNFAVREGVFWIDSQWTLTVTGTGTSAFEVESGGKLQLTDENLDIAGGIWFWDGSQADVSGGNIYCGTNFRVNNNTAYNIQFTGGTLVMDGSGTQYIDDLDGSTKLYNLSIQKSSGTCYLKSNDLAVSNNLTINSGVLSCTNGPSPTITYSIHMGGNWINNVGPAGFDESTSVVYFDGNHMNDQTCSTETFHYLVVNKQEFSTFKVNGGNVTCASYDWVAGGVTVQSGSFTANDLYDNGIFGVFWLYNGGQIDLTNNDGYVDLNSFLYIFGGVFNVHGGTTMSYWPYASNAAIYMSDGILDFKDQGIRIHQTSYTLSENITGGTIRTAGNLHSFRNDWHPDGGTFMMYGPNQASFNHVSGSGFNHLVINKETTYPLAPDAINPFMNLEKEENPPSGMKSGPADGPLVNNVIASGSIDLNGDFILSSGVFEAPDTMFVAGNWANYAGLAAFNENTCVVEFDGAQGSDILTQEHFYEMVLNKTFTGFEGLEVSDSVSITRDLKITDGTLELNSGAILHIGEDLNIDTDAGLNANDAGPIRIYCGQLWSDYNSSFDNYKGFSCGVASSVVFNSSPTTTIQVIRSLNPFNDIEINSQAPWVRSNNITKFIECNNLNIVAGVFRVSGAKVIVNNNLNISGKLSMINADDSLLVAQDVIWHPGSTDEVDAGKIFVGDDWTFENGTLAQLDPVNQVIFNSGQTAMILCNDADAAFGSLVIDKAAGPANSVYIHGSSSDTLRVSGNMTVRPSNTFQTQSKKMIVTAQLDVQNGGLFYMTTGYLRNDNNAFALNGTMDVNDGTVMLKGHFTLPPTGKLIISGGSMTSDPPPAEFAFRQYQGRLELSSGLLEIRNDHVFISGGFDDQISGGTFRILGAFQANAAGTFQPAGGTVWFGQDYLTAYKTFYCSNGNYFHHLTIDGDMQLETNLQVNGNINLISNNLRVLDKTISLRGDWINAVGTGGFSAMTGKVVFNSDSDHQDCIGNTNFNILEIDKGFGDLIIPTGSTAHCAEYDWTDGELEVNGGTFIADDLTDNGLYGNYYVTLVGGLLEVHQDAGQYTDLNGRVVLAGGEMHVYGGNGDSYWPYAADADIWMYGGILDFKDNGVYLNASAYTLNEIINGGLIRMNGGFTGLRTDFNPAGGSIELYGSSTGDLGHAAGSSLHNVIINKTTAVHVEIPSDGLQINGDLDILEGAMTLNNDLVNVGGDVRITDGGYLQMINQAELVMTDADSVSIHNGGEMFIDGDPGLETSIHTNNPLSYFSFDVFPGGAIAAEHNYFSNLAPAGLNLHPGSSVNPAHSFHFCRFSDGAPGGTLLTINNDQTFFADYAYFPANTWGGASNVTKGVDAGSVTFTNYSGGFGGEAFDNDPFNHIFWVEPLSVTASALPEEICEGASTQLNAVPASGTPPYFFNWAPAADLSDPAIANPVATPANTTTYSVTVTDNVGATATASVTVTVNSLPVVVCPPGFDICLDFGVLYMENINVIPVSNSSSSVFTGPGVTPSNPANGWYDFDPVAAGPGTHTITYTYTDANGCSNSCTFDITVLDLPVVSCPADTGICINSGFIYLETLDVWPLSVDENSVFSGIGVTAFEPAMGQYDFNPLTAGPGTHQITYTYTDANGCSNFCTFFITVYPLPSVSCPPDISMCLDAPALLLSGGTPVGGTYSGPGVIGNVFDPALAGLGTHLISYVLTDGNGCTEGCTFSITVLPPPVVSCPPDFSICLDNGVVFLENLGVSPVSNSISSVFTGTGVTPSNPANGWYDFDPLTAGPGTHTITYTYTDALGCSNSCTFNITVLDLPVVSCPADTGICINTGYIYLENLGIWPPSVDENSVFTGIGVTPFIPEQGMYDFDPLSAGPGTHQITYTYTDANGCSNFCTFFITVYPLPTVSCPPDISMCLNATALLLTGGFPAGGTYSGPGVIGNVFDPALAGVGTHLISYVFADGNGCTEGCTFSITVLPIPEVSCPPDFNYCINDGVLFLELLDVSPPCIDIMSLFSGNGVFPADPYNGWYNFDPLIAGTGTHLITYTYYDLNGCQNYCTFSITVLPVPVVSCPPDMIVALSEPPFSLSGGNPAGGYYSGTGIGLNTFYPATAGVGNHLILYIYEDENGCSDTCTFTITVNEPPSVTCPPNLFVCLSEPAFVLTGGTPAGGSYSGTGVIGDSFDPVAAGAGIHQITYTYTDGFGFSNSCNFDITVYPLPTVTCPPDISMCIDAPALLLTGGLPEGGSYSGTGVINNNFDPAIAGAGVHNIIYNFIDINGCMDGCEFTITVLDLPVVSCPGDTAVCINSGVFYLENLDVWPPSVDAGSVFTGNGVIPFIPAQGLYDFNPVAAGTGTHLITYTYTDVNGCSNFCTFNVTVYPLPSVSCPPDITICIDAPALPLTGGLPEGGNYSGTGVAGNIFDPAVAGAGIYLITYNYIDINGCENSCEFTITVSQPEVICPPGILICINAPALLLSGGIPEGGTFSGPGVTGNMFDPAAAGAGSHELTYTITDTWGCTASCTFIVTVNPLPTADAGADAVIIQGNSTTLNGSGSGGNPPYAYAWSPAASLSDPLIANPLATPAVTTVYTLTVVDTYGCYDADEVTVTVIPAGSGIVNGTISYDNAGYTSLSAVSVSLMQSGIPVYNTVSGSGGYYEFTGVAPGSYDVHCASTTPWGGVNASDALVVLKHFTGMTTLTGLPLLAANVDLIPAINSIDALMIARRFTGLILSFPVGDWVFEPTVITVVDGTTTTQNLLGMCYGDANRTYLPPYKSPARVLLAAEGELPVFTGSITDIPITTPERLEAGALSLVVDYPEDQVLISAVTEGKYSGNLVYHMKDGLLRIAWYSERNCIFEPGESLIVLKAMVYGNPDAVTFNALQESEVGDHEGQFLANCRLTYPKLSKAGNGSVGNLSVMPNPFSNTTELNLYSAGPGSVLWKLFNSTGQQIREWKQQLPCAGLHSMILEGEDLAEGCYTIIAEVTEGQIKRNEKARLVVIR